MQRSPTKGYDIRIGNPTKSYSYKEPVLHKLLRTKEQHLHKAHKLLQMTITLLKMLNDGDCKIFVFLRRDETVRGGAGYSR